MTADLDRLDLELRSIPGVVAVGLLAAGDEVLAVQVVARQPAAPDDLRERVRKSVEICPQPVRYDLVVEPGPGGGAAPGDDGGPPAP